jgi:acetyl esterase/lipase
MIAGLVMLMAALATPATKPATKPVLPPAPAGVIIEQNVTYLAPDREEKLDLYLPQVRDAASGVSPAVVIIHGGGWVGGDKAGSREFNIGTTLAKAGYVCASINYTMDRAHLFPNNLHDCKNAVRFLRASADKYQINPARIGVIGGSAGGHLALMVAYTSGVAELEPSTPYPGVSSEVHCVVDMYGITNLMTRSNTSPDGTPTTRRANTALVRGTRDENPAGWNQGSPVFHVSPKSPPTLILHGTADTTVDRNQATELAARLKENGVEHELIMLDGIGHTFDLQTWNRKPLPRDLRPVVIEFFDKHLKRD